MNTSERALLDTNILVYAADASSAFHADAKALRDRGLQGELSLVLSPQVLLEFFAVTTNPRRVSNPRSPQEAMDEVEKYRAAGTIQKIFPGDDILERVQTLWHQHPQVTRQEIFDLHLVATMLTNGVTRIYTYNTQDFASYTEITVLTPPHS
jgi:uncharacterized protein